MKAVKELNETLLNNHSTTKKLTAIKEFIINISVAKKSNVKDQICIAICNYNVYAISVKVLEDHINDLKQKPQIELPNKHEQEKQLLFGGLSKNKSKSSSTIVMHNKDKAKLFSEEGRKVTNTNLGNGWVRTTSRPFIRAAALGRGQG